MAGTQDRAPLGLSSDDAGLCYIYGNPLAEAETLPLPATGSLLPVADGASRFSHSRPLSDSIVFESGSFSIYAVTGERKTEGYERLTERGRLWRTLSIVQSAVAVAFFLFTLCS